MRYSLFLMCFMFFAQCYGQQKPIYVISTRYNQQVNEFIKNSAVNFKEIRVLVNYQLLDASNSDVVDYKRVEGWLNKWFPDKNANGVLCLDLENKFYQDLKNDPVSREFQTARDEFVNLAKFVKQKRPKLKVGFFGLPFAASNQELDPVFEAVDLLFPACYMLHPAAAKGSQGNIDLIKSKMDQVFGFADRLKKPVIPFFWYLAHGPERSLRFERLSKEEVTEYIEYVENYRSSTGLEISGIAWWDTPTPYSKNTIKTNFLQKAGVGARALNSSQPSTIDESFLYYFDK